MNPFLLPHKDRLQHWKDFRNSLSTMTENDGLSAVAAYWAKAPISKYAYNPEDPTDWLSPWEMVNLGEWCTFSRAIGMEFTLRLSGFDYNRMELVYFRDYTISDQMMALIVDEKHVLNFVDNEVVIMPDNHQEILATWRYDGKRYCSSK